MFSRLGAALGRAVNDQVSSERGSSDGTPSVDTLPIYSRPPSYEIALQPPRPLILLAFHRRWDQRPGPAHWALFIPNRNNDEVGKVIHIMGDPDLFGWRIQFRHFCDMQFTPRTFEAFPLPSRIPPGHVVDFFTSEVIEPSEGGVASDEMERLALEIPPPPFVTEEYPHNPDPHAWIKWYISNLISLGLLEPHAAVIANRAPRV